MKKTIRVGLIGAGGISGVHLDWMQSRDDVEITALCDILPEALEHRRSEYGGTGYSDYKRMLDTEQLDAVWLCTPPLVRPDPLRSIDIHV